MSTQSDTNTNVVLFRELDAYFDRMPREEAILKFFVDPATTALNRRAFELLLNQCHYVAIMDMDSLKFINDTFGHRVGDEFMRNLVDDFQKLAGRLGMDAQRKVFRLGGDEFAVFDQSSEKLERLVCAVTSINPTFSCGMGPTLEAADMELKRVKDLRENVKLRVARGKCPPWAEKNLDFALSVMKSHGATCAEMLKAAAIVYDGN
jgi:GGDEF domain-containing protein